jgi:hypothetical protein
MKRTCFNCKYFKLNEYGVMSCKRVNVVIYTSRACENYEGKENPPQNITLLDFSGDRPSREGEN